MLSSNLESASYTTHRLTNFLVGFFSSSAQLCLTPLRCLCYHVEEGKKAAKKNTDNIEQQSIETKL